MQRYSVKQGDLAVLVEDPKGEYVRLSEVGLKPPRKTFDDLVKERDEFQRKAEAFQRLYGG